MKSFRVVVFVLILLSLTSDCHAALKAGFYVGKCGKQNVESIIRNVVRQRFARDPTIVAALLRMQFHDCFVSGCDASVLLNGARSEKTAPPNLSLRGFDLIERAKAAVEKACPRVVSCADIIAVAARDAVFLSKGMNYRVQTGRRDGVVSLASNVNLPGPGISVSQSMGFFANKGFSTREMVLLIGGGHSVGVAHCSLFQNRLYNFRNTGRPDPSMDVNLANRLRGRCPQRSAIDNLVNLDQTPSSALVVDNGFYKQIKARRGILEIDQAMAFHSSTSAIVTSFANNGKSFQTQFGAAMIKMGAMQVLTGKKGEIRKTCGARPRRSS
ncbi:hypothetical protein MKW98_025990 [Papaver atlanticum]|uniref:Peroxidase n=1 Tax=Papaver atlanticum TaxID=357466 RepID=A0AAD4RYT8_9MAGN|nr:hypothetical protein MKW98_025990 [Papaver atlanticum]